MQTKLLGQMLYYILTTGSGQQTLGEEYCDIIQVLYIGQALTSEFHCSCAYVITYIWAFISIFQASSNGLSPTPARRTLFILYQTLVPYLADRIRYFYCLNIFPYFSCLISMVTENFLALWQLKDGCPWGYPRWLATWGAFQ